MDFQNFKLTKPGMFLILMVLGSVLLDQSTKVVAESKLMVWESEQNLRHYQGQRFHLWTMGDSLESEDQGKFWVSFSFNYVRNQGAAWGALSNLPDHIRIPFFYLITFIAVFGILMYLKTTPLDHRLVRFSLVLVLSGALGNFLDRVRLGYVIDFLFVQWSIPLPFGILWRYDFPNFNWADSSITVGITLLIIDMIFFEPKRNKAALAQEGTASKAQA